jgi:hypothetical protein
MTGTLQLRLPAIKMVAVKKWKRTAVVERNCRHQFLENRGMRAEWSSDERTTGNALKPDDGDNGS